MVGSARPITRRYGPSLILDFIQPLPDPVQGTNHCREGAGRMYSGFNRLIGIAVCLIGLGMSAQAIAAPPGDIQAGREAFNSGKYADAIARLSNVIARGKAGKDVLAKVFYMRGVSYQQLKRLTPAIADFSNAIWLDELPAGLQAKAYMRRGKLRLAMSQHGEALKDMNEAVRLRGDAASYTARGEALIRLGKPKLAIRDFDRALGKKPAARHRIYYLRAQAFEAMGRKGDAVANLRKAVALAPDYQPAGRMLKAIGAAPAISVAALPETKPVRQHILTTGSIRPQGAKGRMITDNIAERDWMSATTLKRFDTGALRKAVPRRPVVAPGRKQRSGARGYVLQLSARKTLETAKITLHHIASINGDLLAGMKLYVEKARSARLGDVYRVRIGPFSGQKQPAKLCDQLKSRGQACFLARK